MRPLRFWFLFLALCLTATVGFARIAGAAPGPVTGTSPITARPIAPALPNGAGTLSPYVDPRQLTGVPFGSHSHWAQPWRAYLPTVPAATFLDGIGVNMGGGDPATVIPVLAAQGVRHVRYEEPWCQVDFDDPTRLDNAAAFTAFLQSCKAGGVRPLILLNGNTGVPCPTRFSQATVAAPVRVGDTAITLTDASAVVPGHTGLTNVTGYAAARPLFTGVSGDTVTLSQPCPCGFAAGQRITLTTLKYCPFTAAGSAEYDATVSGWQRYVLTVADFARAALGPGGFDLEVWNELTFGSDFLDGAGYGLAGGPDMTAALLAATASLAQADPADFAGVGIGDGFANTIPWPAASGMPPGISAIDKHPYHGRNAYPGDNQGGTTLNALFQPDPYAPSYTALFPEYFSTGIQTELTGRDASPFIDGSFSYAGIHGRYAQAGRDIPVWITEYRLDGEPGAADDEVGKSILRFYCFHLNKGVTQADYFNSDDLLAQPDALTALGRACSVMRQGLDAQAAPRALGLLSVADTHGHRQFEGDGTAAHPPLYDRDVFVFLPYQVNARRFVAPYYVMTRDVAKDLPAEAFTLKLSGLGLLSVAQTYDPTTGRYGPATLLIGRTPTITVQATDTPRLLVIDDLLGGF